MAENEVKLAEAHIETLKKMSATLTSAARELAQTADCVVVPRGRHEALEALYKSVQAALSTARMTRCYTDVLRTYGVGGHCESAPPERYNGKRYLVRRDEGGEVARAAVRMESEHGTAVREAQRDGAE